VQRRGISRIVVLERKKPFFEKLHRKGFTQPRDLGPGNPQGNNHLCDKGGTAYSFPIFMVHIPFLFYLIWGEGTGEIEDLVGKDAYAPWIMLAIQVHEDDQETDNDFYNPVPYCLMV